MKPVYPAPRALPSYENLLLEMVEPNILKVTLNRPKAYNALSHGLVEDLTNLSQWLVDEYYNIRVVLLYGGDEAKGFCAGLDVKQGLTDYEETVPGFYHYQIKLGELEWYIAKTPQPWITLIDNVSAGGGFALVPKSMAAISPPNVTYHALSSPELYTDIALCWRRFERSRTVKRFLAMMSEGEREQG